MSILDLFQTVAIIVSLVMTIIQMRLYLKGERISIVTRISERNDSLLNDLIANAAAIKQLDKPFKVDVGGYFADPRVSITYRILNFFDEMYYYYDQGFLAERTWGLYQITMNRLLGNLFAKTFWAHVRDEYNQEIQVFVDKIFDQELD